jgi:hypothetical protein
MLVGQSGARSTSFFQSVTSLDEKAFSHETGGLNKQHCAQNTASSDIEYRIQRNSCSHVAWNLLFLTPKELKIKNNYRFKKGKVNKVLKALVEAQGHKLS